MALVWLITGTSSGFGKELVHQILSRGDSVIATARRLDQITEFANNDRAHGVELDLDWDTERIQKTVEDAIQAFRGRIDVLVNNAGRGIKGISEEVGSQRYRESFQTLLFGQIDVTNAVLPHMRKQKSGTIVMVGSRVSWSPFIGLGAYGAVKAALAAYAETLTLEVQPFGIRVLIVMPAGFRTKGLSVSDIEAPHPQSDYDGMRANLADWFDEAEGWMIGDPVKAMKVVADVVRGEGAAAGRPWPQYLLLGDPMLPAVKARSEKIISVAEEWKDVTRDLNLGTG